MNKFMQEAIKEAKLGIENGHGGPFGCVIVKDGKIVGRGHNTVVGNGDCTQHGEMNAIADACASLGFDLKSCELFTSSFPCMMCFGAICWSNIKNVYYGCTTKDAEDIGFRDDLFANAIDYSKLPLNLIECDRKECLKLFEEYKNINHINY